MDELHWTETALSDLDEIGAYIADDNPRAAETVVRRIVETVAALAHHPRLGPENDDGRTRRLIVSGTPYVAIYRLRERIEVLTIFHAARKWPSGIDRP